VPSDRFVLGTFTAVVLAASTAVVVPLDRHYADDPVEKAQRGEVRGLDALSMFRAANLQRALSAVAAKSPAEVVVQDLTVRASSLELTIEEPANGTRRRIAVDVGFGVHIGDPDDASSDEGVTFRQLDAGVPERMIGEVLARVHRPASDVSYVSPSISSSEPRIQWLVYFESGRIRDRIWRADGNGNNVRRNGT
jgi:hypothetical protein